MCSVPKQVKGGKESEASHEGDSHKSGKYMEVNRSNENSVCSVPSQFEGGKECNASCYMKWIHARMESLWKLTEVIGILCVVCPNKLNEEKSPKCRVKWIHKRMKSAVKVEDEK